MTPWLLITALLALINLFGFLTVRGRFGRTVIPLAVAAALGAGLGNLIGGLTGLELLRLGDYHVVAASVGAQLLMLGTVLLGALLPGGGGEQ